MSRLPIDRAERKKLLTLAVLGVVGLIVLMWTFLGGRSPSNAQAMVAEQAAQPAVDLEGALNEMQQGQRPAADSGKLFGTVDEALDVFLDGWRTQSLPADELRLNVFAIRERVLDQVSPPTPEKPIGPAISTAPASGSTNAATAEVEDPLLAQLRKMRLQTVLISSRNRAALIDGQVLHVGDVLDGFEIVTIDPKRVVVERDGKAYALTLR